MCVDVLVSLPYHRPTDKAIGYLPGGEVPFLLEHLYEFLLGFRKPVPISARIYPGCFSRDGFKSNATLPIVRRHTVFLVRVMVTHEKTLLVL